MVRERMRREIPDGMRHAEASIDVAETRRGFFGPSRRAPAPRPMVRRRSGRPRAPPDDRSRAPRPGPAPARCEPAGATDPSGPRGYRRTRRSRGRAPAAAPAAGWRRHRGASPTPAALARACLVARPTSGVAITNRMPSGQRHARAMMRRRPAGSSARFRPAAPPTRCRDAPRARSPAREYRPFPAWTARAAS